MDFEAVFWDVGGVILDIESIASAQQAFLERVVETYDLPYEVAEAREIWRDAMREHFAGREGRKYRTAREGRQKAARALFDGDVPADWTDLYDDVTNSSVTLNPGVEETLRRLHEAGVYQAIVSDADAGLPQRLERFGIEAYIADVTTSEEVGYVKPDRRMFETAFEKARAAGVNPERGIMVGDKYENDMEGASAVGLATAAYGAEAGPAVDYRLDDVRELLDVVGVEPE